MGRSTILMAEIFRLRKNFGELSLKLLRHAERENDKLFAGMLFEQSALAFLCVGQFRKFCFRVVVGGQCFNSVKQHAHALRCYSAVSDVYEAKEWY
jgi:hypothetical protein